MKQIALSVMFLMLAACSGKNTDNYVGHWQVTDNKGVEFAEIKKMMEIIFWYFVIIFNKKICCFLKKKMDCLLITV